MSDFPPSNLRLKRAYAPVDPGDGARILVDRLWPRGVSKARADLTEWMKDIAPSTALRQWFGHDPAKWAEFQHRYRAELSDHQPELDQLSSLAAQGVVTLIYGARDQAHNEAVVIRQVLRGDAVDD